MCNLEALFSCSEYRKERGGRWLSRSHQEDVNTIGHGTFASVVTSRMSEQILGLRLGLSAWSKAVTASCMDRTCQKAM